jgi:hypothetical protein
MANLKKKLRLIPLIIIIAIGFYVSFKTPDQPTHIKPLNHLPPITKMTHHTKISITPHQFIPNKSLSFLVTLSSFNDENLQNSPINRIILTDQNDFPYQASNWETTTTTSHEIEGILSFKIHTKKPEKITLYYFNPDEVTFSWDLHL